MRYIFLLFLGYLCGSVPVGKLVGKLYGVDIQKRGSGNIGFANVERILGWRPGICTLAADIAKGAAPTFLALQLTSRSFAFWVGLAAIMGHVFPIWLKFRGGKGVATGLGVVIVLQPLAAAVGAAIYIIARLISHNSGRSSLTGIVGVLLVGCVTKPGDWWQYAVLLCVALWTLRKNILGKVPNYDT